MVVKASSRSPDSAAAMAWNAWRSIACCRKWAPLKRPCGNIRWRMTRGAWSFANLSKTFGSSAIQLRACAMLTKRCALSKRYTRVPDMIIARSPLRISLGGGGTDLPSYYRDHGGFLIAAAIDKYVYVTVTRPFTPGIFLKYSKLEHVDDVNDVQHPIIREALHLTENGTSQVEITTLADIPAGTGLGSSGSFTTALLRALSAFHRKPMHP